MSENHHDKEEPGRSNLLPDESMSEGVASEFLNGLEDRLHSLVAAIRANDMHGLQSTAGELEGSGDRHGLTAIASCAHELAACAEAGAVGECLHALDKLRDLCGQIAVDPDE